MYCCLGIEESWVNPFSGMALLAIFRGPFLSEKEKTLDATSKAGVEHVWGPESHASIASLLRILLTMVITIWDRGCGLSRPNFLAFAI